MAKCTMQHQIGTAYCHEYTTQPIGGNADGLPPFRGPRADWQVPEDALVSVDIQDVG